MPFDLSWGTIAIGAAIFVASLVGTSLIAGIFLVRIRPDYFVAEHHGVARRLHSSRTRLLLVVGKNLLGVFLIAFGIVLALPGVPGQGLLTILVGLFLIDSRAKRKLELRIVRRPHILHAINKIRDRFGAPPLEVERAP
jgi:hypothetical protein